MKSKVDMAVGQAPETNRHGPERMTSAAYWTLATAAQPGAIGILQISGHPSEVVQALSSITGEADWPLHRLRLVNFLDIDQGIAVRLRDDVAQLMPHGGQRVIHKLAAKLNSIGVQQPQPNLNATVSPRNFYPEAPEDRHAHILHALAIAQSPLAIGLLLKQLDSPDQSPASQISDDDRARSRRLNRLIHPPLVVLAGPANVGKSTLSNRLLGRSMSIAADEPGTTRDYTAAAINCAGLVVHWHDTPGLRANQDELESRAAEIARHLISRADLLISMTDPFTPWASLPREPDLLIINKIDLDAGANTNPSQLKRREPAKRLNASMPKCVNALRISATTGIGITDLVLAIRNALVPDEDLQSPQPWSLPAHLNP